MGRFAYDLHPLAGTNAALLGPGPAMEPHEQGHLTGITMAAFTAILPAQHPLAQRFGTAYWDCSLTRLERWILPLCIVISMMLQIKAILYSALALPLIGLMAVLCWLTPVSYTHLTLPTNREV